MLQILLFPFLNRFYHNPRTISGDQSEFLTPCSHFIWYIFKQHYIQPLHTRHLLIFLILNLPLNLKFYITRTNISIIRVINFGHITIYIKDHNILMGLMAERWTHSLIWTPNHGHLILPTFTKFCSKTLAQ